MLLERARDPNASPQLVLTSLQAFEELLQRPSKEILDSLLLSHLVGRNYQSDATAEAFDFSDDDQEGLCNRVGKEQPSAEDDQSSDSQPEADSLHHGFYEGPFLSMLLDRIENMHRQPYDVNLLVTSLISRLALFAHPNLHEYLLNPLLPLAPGARSLFTALLKVVEEIQVAVHGMENLKRKLMLTRNALLNDSGDDCALGAESGVLEAIIVLEEFCKELAAVAFVKYHAAA
ncbi:hypothetical protein HPB50_001524 [Hyalomma asiaticum]|uniref:Uncharacterized protein n=1 Tax=Hyalomma asiaticum TaxID=266040 RepID=A0ACB7SJG3_HYAAI|nr:hypothetical protein HPB50_001524 [Hyalomma asiaticum]